MIAVGLVLLVLAVLLTLGIGLFNGDNVPGVEAFGVSLANVSVGALFLTGVVTGVVAALGVGLLLAGLARSRSKTARGKRAGKGARGEADALAEENARLQERLTRDTPRG
jgi:hypothetical protein